MSLSALLAGLAALITLIGGAYAKGRRDRGREAEAREARDYQRTMERIHDAEIVPDADAARRWLRDRKP